MISKLKKSNKEGFTIIEVMIVLAIAGLILLIVFLAVPALQRNARNTQRKTDVGRVGSAATTVVANNNGDITQLNTANVRTEVGTRLSFYTQANVAVVAAVAAVTNGTTVNNVNVVTGGICAPLVPGPGLGATTAGATPRSISVVYSTEAGTGLTPDCTDE